MASHKGARVLTWGGHFSINNPLARLAGHADTLGRVAYNLALLTLGNAVFVYGMKSILIPHRFLSGGVLGLCLIVNYLLPGVSLGLLNFVLNLPLYWLGWKHISRTFMLYTAYGITAFSVLAEILPANPLPVNDPMLAAILAGIVCGVGCGIYMRSLGCGGGTEILAVYLEKKFAMRRGLTGFVTSALVLALSTFIFNLEMALYTLIFSFTCGRVLDAVMTGFNQRKSVLIVSDKAQSISSLILEKLHRGATLLKGTGAYSGTEKQVILCAVSLTEISRLKEMVLSLDPQAFVIINEAMDVIGQGHGRVREY